MLVRPRSARRLAKLTGSPFIKVEATKYTEVGYYGRDVESMIRELVENAISLIRKTELKNVESEAEKKVEERLLDMLVPPPVSIDVGGDDSNSAGALPSVSRTDARVCLLGGELEESRSRS